MPPLLHSPGEEVPIKMKIGHVLLIESGEFIGRQIACIESDLALVSASFVLSIPHISLSQMLSALLFLVFSFRNIDASSIKAVDTANIKVKHYDEHFLIFYYCGSAAVPSRLPSLWS